MGEKPVKVVVVDDNTDYLFTMKTFLSRNGFEVETAPSGKLGLELIKKTHPRLVILDVMMETTYSGFEVCHKIKNDTELKDTLVIGVTGLEDELGVTYEKYEDEDYFAPDAFFGKPVEKTALLDKINELIC